MRSDNAYEVKHGRLCAESPIDGKEIVDAKGNKITRDERHLIGGKETDYVENGSIYHRTCSAHNAETDELLHLFILEPLKNLHQTMNVAPVARPEGSS